MALTDKLTAIAEAIRSKTGKTDSMTLAQMPEEIASISGEELINHADIPDYVKKEVKSLINRIDSVKKDDSIMFIAMSDMHYYDGQKDFDANADPNGIQTDVGDLHGAMGAKILAYLYDFDFMAYLGDHVWGTGRTPPELLANQGRELTALMHEAHKGVPCFHAIGNHDTGLYYDEEQNNNGITGNFLLSGQQLYAMYTQLSDSDNTVFGDTTYGGYCYRDFPNKKLRVYLLNTSESILYEKASGKKYQPSCNPSQLAWLSDSLLNLNLKDDASEWGFIILSHYPADFGSTMPLSEVLRAYVKGQSHSFKKENGSTYNVTFPSGNKAKMIAQFHGHVHNFLTSKLYSYSSGSGVQYDAWRISTPNGMYNRENYYNTLNSYPDISFKDSETFTKVVNSGKDTSFVVNIINPSEEVIYSLCYGAGKDRVIGYKQVTYYSVLNTLINMSISNPTIAVQEGASYEATLTPRENYEMVEESLVIMMGDTNITNSCYKDGKITIPAVTGNIVITASAIRPLASVNQIAVSTDVDNTIYNYQKGWYIDSSNGNLKELKSSYVTGFMPYKVGQEIRLSNVGFNKTSANQVYNRIATYNSQKEFIGFFNAGNEWTLLTWGQGILDDQNNWTYFILKKGANNALTDDVAFIRISCEYLDPDSIITIDEEILYKDEVAGITYSVTSNLTNITSTNPTAFLPYGAEYSAKITVNQGKYFESITIQMGTKDITSEVYNHATGDIFIKRVYDNIVITGVATGYKNLIPSAVDNNDQILNGVGYKAGYYLSSSSGNESANSKYVVTGFIPCKVGDTVYLKNLNFNKNASDSGYHRIGLYGPNKEFLAMWNSASTAVPLNVQVDSNGYWTKFTIRNPTSGKDTTSTTYLRLCCPEIKSTSVITVNEPIE